MIVDLKGTLKKVQVKYADCKSNNKSWRCTCVSSTNHTTNKNLHGYENDVDIIAFYIAELDKCIMFNIQEVKGKTCIHVREENPANNQSTVVFIKDHTFDKYL